MAYPLSIRIQKALTFLRKGRFDLLLYYLCRTLRVGRVPLRYPISLMIEPANACNLRCPTCPTGSGKLNRPRRLMRFAEFKTIVDQAAGHVEDIILWGWGEPFLNRELLKMIRYAVSARMHVITSTNGEFFGSESFCSEVVDSGIDHLIVCLDGADQRTISEFRKGSDFEKILRGLNMLRQLKRGLGSRKPILELQFIVMKHNEHQRSRMRELAKRLEVDIYTEKTVWIDFNDPAFQELARELLPSELSRSRYSLREDGTYALKGEIASPCNWVYECLVINSDGSVIPCCYDINSRHVLGNAFKEPLRAIWLNARHRAFREKVRTDRKGISICRSCSEGRYEVRKRNVLARIWPWAGR
jgi:radical SAM protein with 4Fe4S-binding SPASM domain